jgi:hypothetical protein
MINQLKASPLFNLSLSSKELFHSNLLSWFFEQNENLTLLFFSKKINRTFSKISSIKRENRNLDLSIEFDNSYTVIIENKVKSIPNKKQLYKYRKLIGSNSCLFLLSLYKPHDFEEFNFISYEEIRNIFVYQYELEKSPYLKGLYNDYSQLLKLLLELTKDWSNMKKFDFHTRFNKINDKNDYLKYKEIRIHDLFHKVKYNQFTTQLFEATTTAIPNYLLTNLEPFNYFSSGTGASSLWYFLQREKQEIRLELQIQDNMLRLMIVSKNCVKNIQQIYKDNAVSQIYSLFQEKIIVDITEELIYPKEKEKGFNVFGNDIIYKYKRIKEVDLKTIINNLTEYFKKVIETVEKNKKIIVELLNNESV